MPLASDLIDQVVAELHGYGQSADRITALTADIALDDTSLTVDAVTGSKLGVEPGILEIDGEQLYAATVDSQSNTVTLASGFGRGFSGTTPAAHTAGSIVRSGPMYPRSRVLEVMNDVINSLFPDLFAVWKVTTAVTFPINSYTLPSIPSWIITAQWQDVQGNWQPVDSYEKDSYDYKFRLGSQIQIGRPLRIIYAGTPVLFADETSDYSTTGLPPSAADLLKIGTVARMVPAIDISRPQLSTVEQSDRGRVVPPNAGLNAGKYLQDQFNTRLENEKRSQKNLYPPRLRKVW